MTSSFRYVDGKTTDRSGRFKTGFEAEKVRRVRHSAAGQKRLLDKMDSVDESRARAVKDSRTAFVG